jgi:hypothetical protein
VIDAEPNGSFRFKSVNRAFLAATGLSENQIVGKLARNYPEPLTLGFGKYKEVKPDMQSIGKNARYLLFKYGGERCPRFGLMAVPACGQFMISPSVNWRRLNCPGIEQRNSWWKRTDG